MNYTHKYDIEKIEPKAILKWFKKICSIPHGSFKEQKLAKMLKDELEKAGCRVKQLESGALYIQCNATFGHANWPTVLLQGHMDMVQVRDEGVSIDFDNDPIPVYYDTQKKWLKAEGTTLGADNGIALSMFMELFTNPTIEHGPLEGLFTVGEEVDTTPCMKSIPNNLLKADYYINLDSDHDDTIYYASAGVYSVEFTLPINFVKPSHDFKTYEITLKNFSGGHSALAIHFPHINPIIFGCKALLRYNQKQVALLNSINGGIGKNSIPTSAKFVVQIKNGTYDNFVELLNYELMIAKVAAQGNEDDATIEINEVTDVAKVLSLDDTNDVLSFFAYAPNDMIMPNKNGGVMFNSSNVGFVKTKGSEIQSAFLPRSFYKPDLINLANDLAIYAKRNGAIIHSFKSSCACWLTPNHEASKIINLWKDNYKVVTGKEPNVLPNPGGLEVAEIVTKNEKMMANAMSAGPIIYKEHSTFENCPVESIEKIWNILLLTLKGLNN